jgi:hypothetical protein
MKYVINKDIKQTGVPGCNLGVQEETEKVRPTATMGPANISSRGIRINFVELHKMVNGHILLL